MRQTGASGESDQQRLWSAIDDGAWIVVAEIWDGLGVARGNGTIQSMEVSRAEQTMGIVPQLETYDTLIHSRTVFLTNSSCNI